MRIMYLYQYFTPLEGNGPTRVYEFARRLVANGHELCMVTSTSYLPEPYHSVKKVTRVEIGGIPTVVIPVPYANRMSFPRRILAFLHFAIWACLEVLRHPTDVILASSPPLTMAIPGLIAHLWHRKPLVFEVRDLWPEMPIAMGALRGPLMIGAARALEWGAYRASAHIIAASPGMADGVMKRGYPAECITVIPNSCDLDLFDVPASKGDAIRGKLGLAPGQPLAVYTGQFGMVYGVDYLIDVAYHMKSLLPEARFLLVGTGKERAKLLAQAKELDVLDKNVWIWDPIPKAEVPALLAAATVAISVFIPLKPMWNNSSNKFFDALAAGKPVSINYGGWQADLLKESGAGIVMPDGDPAQASKDLAALFCDPERLRAASLAARKLALKFDRNLMFQKLEAVLTQFDRARNVQ